MQKYSEMGKSFNDIYDLLAIRVLVDSLADCYHALGIVHGLWRPLPGLFDDYIANPRENVYQSLHTTVMGPGARPLEVQIRTYEMHKYGRVRRRRALALQGGRPARPGLRGAHHLAAPAAGVAARDRRGGGVRRVHQDGPLPRPGLRVLAQGRGQGPAGRLDADRLRVPHPLRHRLTTASARGSTAACVPLTYQLQNGDVVEIVTSRSSRGPSRDWLNPNLGYVRTGNARSKIRQWFKRQERDENVLRGKEMVERELKRLGVSVSETCCPSC